MFNKGLECTSRLFYKSSAEGAEDGVAKFTSLVRATPYARSFRRRVFAFHYAVNRPPTNIILS